MRIFLSKGTRSIMGMLLGILLSTLKVRPCGIRAFSTKITATSSW